MDVITIILGLISATMLGLLIYQLTVGPIGKEPAPDYVFLLEFILMSVVTVLCFNFRALDLILTYDGIIVRFGKIRKVVLWSDIESYHAITTGNLTSGGLHLGPTRGGWSAEYTVLGKPRIVLRLRSGIIKQLVFSTGNPQEVVKIIKEQTGKDADSQL